MIEISARLPRGSIFFAGSSLDCLISVRNLHPEEKAEDSSTTESLLPNGNAFSPVAIHFFKGEIHCQCIVDETKINPAEWFATQTAAEESHLFAAKEGREAVTFCVASSGVKTISGGFLLQHDEVVHFHFSETIPLCSIPSFRGSSLKYSWKLAFECQVDGRSSTLIHIPIWVMAIQDLPSLLSIHEDAAISDGVFETDHQADHPQPPVEYANGDGPTANHHSGHKRRSSSTKPVTVDSAMQILDFLTSRRSTKVYGIDAPQGRLGKLTLSKTRIRLGDEIQGRFDFADRSITCAQYLVTLIAEESIHEKYRRLKTQDTVETIVSKTHDFCLCLMQSSFSLPVPLHITAGFSSEIIDLKWKLRFEFSLSPETLSLEVPSVGAENQSVLWRPPLMVPVETFSWDVPVEIMPSDPAQIHSVHLRDSLGSDVKIRIQ